KMELISVIVPVYKVEKYLNKCVESIVNQTYKNLEIILVDDGSPDNCPKMCDEWAEKDSRIKVIHQENGGGSKARNVGKSVSSGQWVMFIDSDDYLSEDMIAVLFNNASENIDIIECEFLLTEDDNVNFDKNNDQIEIFATQDAMKLHIEDKSFRQTVWNKLYRKSVLCNVDFPEGKLIDDEFFTYKAIGNARNLVHIYKKLYAYRQQTDSVMHKAFSLGRFHAIEAKCERLDYLSNKFPDLVTDAKINLWGTCLYLGQCALKHLQAGDKKEAFKIINRALQTNLLNKNDLSLLSFDYKIWAVLSKISMKFTCKIRNLLKIGV
ncbi:MAG: glycosyltransferase, partial [Clostridia bacterium]|nr:glycosyltransferase [Clostridia bacterium]